MSLKAATIKVHNDDHPLEVSSRFVSLLEQMGGVVTESAPPQSEMESLTIAKYRVEPGFFLTPDEYSKLRQAFLWCGGRPGQTSDFMIASETKALRDMIVERTGKHYEEYT